MTNSEGDEGEVSLMRLQTPALVLGGALLLAGCEASEPEQRASIEYRMPATPTTLVERPEVTIEAAQVPAAPSTFSSVSLAVETPTPVLPPQVVAQSVATSAAAKPVADAAVDGILQAAGWPAELWEQARLVAYCESRWNPNALGDSGRSLGFFQLNSMWFGYAQEPISEWADPVVNARVAFAVYNYDLQRGNPAWWQWTCKKVLSG